MRLAACLHRLRHNRVAGLDVLYLTTVGARSGQERTVPLAFFPDGDGWLLVASNGGAVRHPAWMLNLAAHPDRVWAEVGGRRRRVTATTLAGEERAARFAEIAAAHPRYAGYAARTDREIPIVRLRPSG
jgi:deazaflavin-dependent oxidoreductase (nitroreductase family)